MLLGSRNIGVGDTRLYRISYKDFLAHDAIVDTATISLPAGITSTKGAVTISPNGEQVWFLISGGVLNEAFTVSVQVTDSTGQIANDTVSFLVIAP